MGWLLNLLVTFICEALIIVIDDLSSYIDNIFQKMYEINKNLGFEKIYDYSRRIALIIVGTYAIKLLFDIYVLHTDGDPDADPLEMLTRIAKAVAVIICGQFVVEKGIELAGKLATDFQFITGYLNTGDITLAESLKGLITMYTLSVGILLIIIAIIIGLLMFIFKAAKRGAELILIGVMLPFAAIDILTTSKERWNSFVSNAMVTIMGYVIQLFCFEIFMTLFKRGTERGEIEALLACLAWLGVVLSAPKMLQKYLHKTGVGDLAKGVTRTGVNVIPYFIKK